MTFRKIALTFLMMTVGAASAYAKKEPKYEAVRPLTPEQSALVDRAIAQEKVLIQAIRKRTPLVETYIQNTRPDVKLYMVPVWTSTCSAAWTFPRASSTRALPTAPPSRKKAPRASSKARSMPCLA